MSGQHGVWERIAASFDRSRTRMWPHVVAYLEDLPPGRVLDLMAGNGRHVPAARHLDLVAADWSRPLMRTVRARHHVPTVVADAQRLPFRDATFDACVYVAGLHGIPTAAGRADSLRELKRVLRPGATAQLTVWSRHAPRFRSVGPPGPMDTVLPWRADGHDEVRTYHLYTAQSLQAALEETGFSVESMTRADVLGGGPDNEVALVRA